MKVIFIRHGQSTNNAGGLLEGGGENPPLTELGKQQASKAAEFCKEAGVLGVYSSAQLRGVQTAEIIAKACRLKSIVIPELHERNWGEFEGREWREVRLQLSDMSNEERFKFKPKGGESWAEMEERVKFCIEKITQNPHAVVAVVTHGGFMRAMMPLLKKEPKETANQYEFLNGSITEFECSDGKWISLKENDVSYLG